MKPKRNLRLDFEWLAREKFLGGEYAHLPSDRRDQLIAFDKKRYFAPESITLAEMMLLVERREE